MKVHKVKVPAFGVTVLAVFIHYDVNIQECETAVRAAIKRKTGAKLFLEWTNRENNFEGFCQGFGPLQLLVIRYDEKSSLSDLMDISAHELSHSIGNLARHLGFKYSKKSWEWYAYMTGHITGKLTKFAQDYAAK